MDRCSGHLVWVLGLLEGLTVPLVVILARSGNAGPKTPLHGLVAGAVGVALVLVVVNAALRRIDVSLGDGRRLEWISPLPGALWAGLILGLLFWFQRLVAGLLVWPYPAGHLAVGFLATSAGFASVCWAYPWVTRGLPALSVAVRTSDRNAVRSEWRLAGVSVLGLAMMAGLYEAIALPVIAIWTFHPSSALAVSLASGPLGGLAGGMGLCLFYNQVRFRPPCEFRFVPVKGQAQGRAA